MLFKDLDPGERFTFPEALGDGEVAVYIKIERPIKNDGSKPITAIKSYGGSLMCVPDDAEVIGLAL